MTWIKEIQKRIPKSQHDRVILSAAAAVAFNLAYALYHGIVGVLSQSSWLLILCAYYIILSVMRFCAVLHDRKGGQTAPAFSERFLLGFLGGMLVLLASILAFSVYLSFCLDVAVPHNEILMITIATYTFYKITMAVINDVKARRRKSALLVAIRNIGCADAGASLLTLQRSMLVSFEGMSPSNIAVMNALTGAGVCILIWILGMTMITKKEDKSGKIKTGKSK